MKKTSNLSSCNYNITFIHSNHDSLKSFIEKTSHKDMSFVQKVRKAKGKNFFTAKASVFCEESSSDSFTDFIKKTLDLNENLEVGGTFSEPSGEGYIDCFGDKHYTKIK